MDEDVDIESLRGFLSPSIMEWLTDGESLVGNFVDDCADIDELIDSLPDAFPIPFLSLKIYYPWSEYTTSPFLVQFILSIASSLLKYRRRRPLNTSET